MTIPQLNQDQILKAATATSQLIEAYTEDLENLEHSIKSLKLQLKSAKALQSLLERSSDREVKLKDCGELSILYSNFIAGEDLNFQLASASNFVGLIQGKIDSFKYLRDESRAALNLLKNDLRDLEELSGKEFPSIYYYYSMPCHGWSLSFIGKLHREFVLLPSNLCTTNPPHDY